MRWSTVLNPKATVKFPLGAKSQVNVVRVLSCRDKLAETSSGAVTKLKLTSVAGGGAIPHDHLDFCGLEMF